MNIIALNDRRALRPKDAAQYASLGRTRIFELLAEGKIDSVKVGRSRLILRDSLDRLLSAETREAA